MYAFNVGFGNMNAACCGTPYMMPQQTMPQQTMPPMMGSSCCSGGFDMNAYAFGAKQRVMDVASSLVQKLIAAGQSLKQQLQAEGLTDEQKNKITAEIEKIQKAIEMTKELVNGNATVQDAVQAQMAIDNMLTETAKTMQTIAQEIAEAQAKKQQDAENAEQSGQADGSADASADEAEGGDGTVKVGDVEIDSETGRAVELGEGLSPYEASSIAFQVKKAVDGPGTNHDILDPIVQNLNAGNIVEIVKAWEGKCGQHSESGNDGFFARIFDDVDDKWQNENVPVMLDALVKRAEAAGIKQSEIEEYIGGVHNGMSHSTLLGMMEWHDDHEIANNLMKIYEKIVAKEKELKSKAGTQAADNKKKADEAKAAEDKKKEDKKQEAINLFISDMREIYKDDKLEKSDKVKFEDGVFKIRIEGKDYQGSDFRALEKAVKDAGYDPKEYLCKKQVDAKA